MNLIPLDIKDAYIISNNIYKDNRGFLLESYNENLNSHFNVNFVQDNIVFSKSKNTFRGMHFQTYPFEQSKLITVLKGKIIDILLDIREDSPSFNKIIEIELDDSFEKSIFIPKGVAHGYLTLSDETVIMYKLDNKYSPNNESGINIKNIQDKLKLVNLKYEDFIISDKDKILKWIQF